jgi:hypothetical protein
MVSSTHLRRHRLPLGPSNLWQLPIILVYAGPPTATAANSWSPRRGRRTHGVAASYRAGPPTKSPCTGSTPPPDCQVGPFLSHTLDADLIRSRRDGLDVGESEGLLSKSIFKRLAKSFSKGKYGYY